jgi:RimJ/RimL family protein N-acetyltransferase
VKRFTTDRLFLRPLSLDDVDLLVELDSDPEVMRYINGGRPSTRTEVEEIVRRSLGHRWIACEHGTGRFVGWFALRPTGEGVYEVGYRLRRDSWGRGLATEGTRALIGAAFEVLGAERVWAETMAVNTRSRAVMERCGMRYVRTFHLEWDEPIEGTEEGDVEYEVLREAQDVSGVDGGGSPGGQG